MAFVKSGWLLRQSTILKCWKKNWFDLWLDGHLIYYDDQTRQSIEDKVHMPVDCINIRVGHKCWDIQPPDGKSKDYMLQIVCRDGKIIQSLCRKTNTAYVDSSGFFPSSYVAYATPTPEQAYGYGPHGAAYPPGTQVVYATNGQAFAQPTNQVIIHERDRDRDSDLALGMLAGAATGMALGSLFWVF
uniref:PH domain-containing protein n=1 Tax=Propithecus coquereli TaxID=379532 RepID=A0A2K6EV93_PROCO